MTKISERIALIIENKGISVRSVEQSIGCSNGVISRCLSKGTDISSLWASKIIEIFQDISAEWLLTGEGTMLKENKEEGDYDLPPIAHPTEENEGIPLIPLDAMAGVFTSEETILEYECERYIVPAFNGANFLINVKGTSMMPTYHSGDIVACKRVSLTDIFFQWGKAYVLDTDQGPLVKRIRQSKIKDHIVLVSDNSEEYQPIDLHMRHINGIALIIGTIRLE